MAAKLLMRWDVRPETESEYFEFLVHEFIPGLNKLGISDIQVWYTQYGDCEQKLASGIAENTDKMQAALTSPGWDQLNDKLQQFVENFSQKVISATGGFQI
ncbi:MAG: hypothetical protein H6652_03545 [Ardenticatenaceae bacterium]|nr:hypothetical protein [Ardenticatenaceae bacterium]